MDLPAPFEQPGADAQREQTALGGETETAPSPPEPTLVELQRELTALSHRLDALASSFEASVRAAVAEEVQRVAGDLQHTVAALGRVLVRDLGRLNQILTQHRDAILAELRATPTAARTPGSSQPAAEPGGHGEPGAPPDGEADQPRAAGDQPSDDDKGRSWRRRKG